jgi:hypothetical protein
MSRRILNFILFSPLALQAGNFSTELTRLETQKAQLKTLIEKSIKDLHILHHSGSNLHYAWEKQNPHEEDRKKLEKIIQLTLSSRLENWNAINTDLEKIYQEQEILDAEMKVKPQASQKNAPFFRCPFFPLPKLSESHRYNLIEKFGSQKDTISGLSWKSSGWWIGVEHMTPVKSCDAGTVIYKGKIPGRGLVVLIRHKHEYLSLYANLEESDLNNLTLGKNIEAGETLGTVKDKLYFEMRRNGESLEPSLLFSSKQTERLKETKL